MLEWLENWYDSQCDGNWEHNYGVKIETIDNPGWNVNIDLNDIISKNLSEIKWNVVELSDKKWVGYKIENNKFNGACDPNNLNLIIYIFKELMENGQISEVDIKSKLNSKKIG